MALGLESPLIHMIMENVISHAPAILGHFDVQIGQTMATHELWADDVSRWHPRWTGCKPRNLGALIFMHVRVFINPKDSVPTGLHNYRCAVDNGRRCPICLYSDS